MKSPPSINAAWWALALLLLAADTAISITYYRDAGGYDFRWLLALLDVSVLVAFYAASGRRVTGFLVSMKLALTLLFVIAIISIIGTLLPQGKQVYESGWVNNPLYDFYRHLGLFEMYKSRWFLIILFLLGFNLSVCISRRLPGVIRYLRSPTVDVSDKYIAGQQLFVSFPGTGRKELDDAGDVLDGMRYRLHNSASGTVLAQKGRFAPLASLFFHFSFLVVALGGLLGYNFGFDESVVIPEGEKVAIPNTNFQASNVDFSIKYEPVIENGRETGSIPVEYKTVLELFRDGARVAGKEITVNDPLRYEGVNFYQSGYDMQERYGREVFVSIIQVNRFPGKWLVYAGFILMTAGVIVTLYFPGKKIWLKVDDEGKLIAGGRTGRSKVSFQREFDRMAAELRHRWDRRSQG